MTTKICPKCGEDNPTNLVVCWACYMPLDGSASYTKPISTSTKACLKCGESNPVEAIMCWACYTMFDGSEPQVSGDSKIISLPIDQDAILPSIAILTLISSGWLPKKSRLWVLGAGAALAAVKFALQLRDAKQRARQVVDEENDPIRRIANTIGIYALKDGANQIRLTRRERGIQVEYKIADEWHEQMKIPMYVWQDFKNHLLERAESGNIKFEYEDASGEFSLRLLIEPPHEELLLTPLPNS